MARKSSAKLKDGPITLPPDAEAHLAKLAEYTPYPGSEDQWARFLSASRRVEEQHVRVAEFGTDFGSSDPRWPEFQEALRKLAAAHTSALGACDAWKAAEKRAKAEEARQADPMQSNVEFKSVHLLVSEEFSESGAELQWNVKSAGLVAYKLAEAVSGFVVREEAQEPPLCESCR